MKCTAFQDTLTNRSLCSTVQDSSLNSSANPFVQIDVTVAIAFSSLDGTGIIFGTLANMVMIALVLTQSHLQSTTDIFTSSLCISDLLAGILFQPFVIRRLLARRPNPPYEWALRRFVGQTTLSASSFSLVAATVDRYAVLKWPLRHHDFVPKSTAISIVGVLWLVSLALGLVAYLERELAAFVFPVVVAVIVVVVIFFQTLIFFIAKKQVIRIWNSSQRGKCHYYQLKCLKHMKATKTIILLLTVFLLSWLPSTVFRFYDRFTGGNIKTFHRWLHVLNSLIQIHCCFDPYLYVFRNRRFKSVLLKVLKRHYQG